MSPFFTFGGFILFTCETAVSLNPVDNVGSFAEILAKSLQPL